MSAMPWTVQKEKEQYYTEHARYAVEIYSEMTAKECMCVCVCVCVCVSAQVLSCVQLFVTPWTVAHQASLSMEFFR